MVDIVVGTASGVGGLLPGDQVFIHCRVIGNIRAEALVVTLPGDEKGARLRCAGSWNYPTHDIPVIAKVSLMILPDYEKFISFAVIGNAGGKLLMGMGGDGDLASYVLSGFALSLAVDIGFTAVMFLPDNEVVALGAVKGCCRVELIGGLIKNAYVAANQGAGGREALAVDLSSQTMKYSLSVGLKATCGLPSNLPVSAIWIWSLPMTSSGALMVEGSLLA